MSQVFSGDSVNNTASTTVTTTTETVMVTGNFVNPPFQTAKAMVSGTVNLLTGTGTTAVVLRIRRNPNAENVQVGAALTITAAATTTVQLSMQAADAIPDGRPVQYAVTVQQTGAGANGTGNFSNVSTILISG